MQTSVSSPPAHKNAAKSPGISGRNSLENSGENSRQKFPPDSSGKSLPKSPKLQPARHHYLTCPLLSVRKQANLHIVRVRKNLHTYITLMSPLFLSGVYGDVQRVKVLFNKKDNALIQYAEPAQAQLGTVLASSWSYANFFRNARHFSAIQHLDKMKLWGKQIRVASSKHMNVQMPKEGQPVSEREKRKEILVVCKSPIPFRTPV